MGSDLPGGQIDTSDQGYLPEYLARLRFPNLPAMHFRIALRRFIIAIRYFQRVMSLRRPSDRATAERSDVPIGLIGHGLDEASEHFRSKRWAYVDGILDAGFHRRLLRDWPRRRFLDPPRSIEKSYDTGFRWVRGLPAPSFFQHPVIAEFFDYMRSEEVGRRVTKLFGQGRDLSCYSFLLSQTSPGSCVAAHKDGVFYTPDARHFLNLFFFIDGSGGTKSGGLCILGDRLYQDVIFETPKLRNTGLFYDSGGLFFHGFEPVKRGKFRWAISAQFCATDYDESAA